MRNIKLTLEYDGTDFVGWQSQANGRSVQEDIKKVLEQVLQEEIVLHGAGRTDSGVHARGQVANFLTISSLSTKTIHTALNGNLPNDICVHETNEVPATFNARRDAIARVYRYYIASKPLAISRQYQWFVKYTLDVMVMRHIAEAILGEHDFESFCKYDTEVERYKCAIMKSEWTETQTGLVYEVKADRFLYGMVRALVGTMVDIGRKRIAVSTFPDIMAAKDRTRAGMAAPAHGLYLEQVIY